MMDVFFFFYMSFNVAIVELSVSCEQKKIISKPDRTLSVETVYVL